MGVVNLISAQYYNNKLSEKEYIRMMIKYQDILQDTMLEMYKTIARSDNLPENNTEGCIETIIMRSVHSAMSSVRHMIKHDYEVNED